MPDLQVIENVRKETWGLEVYKAFQGRVDTTPLITKLTKSIREIYRYLEPSYFSGKLLIYIAIDDSPVIDHDDSITIIDKNILLSIRDENIVFCVRDSEPLLMWNGDFDSLIECDNVIVYEYENKKEIFYANNVKIPVLNYLGNCSIFETNFLDLSEKLTNYSIERVLYSSCSILDSCWYDEKRIFLKAKPENNMQISLKEYLTSSLRGVDVVREYNLGASKPVDIRVYWKEANREALIEIKWLGQSVKDSGELATAYSNARATDGMKQIKEYIDLDAKDTPTAIAKGILVVIDARRKGNGSMISSVDSENGLFFQNKHLEIPEENQYYKDAINIEKPVRMFVTPICN